MRNLYEFLALCPGPGFVVGTAGAAPFRRQVRLSLPEITQHAHVIGVSGSGKSRFLAGFFLSLLRLGLPATLIDPHGDLARLVLGHLIERGLMRPEAFDRILYLDLPEAERRNRFLAFNVLAQHGSDDAVAANVKEAFHRAWPEPGDGPRPLTHCFPTLYCCLSTTSFLSPRCNAC